MNYRELTVPQADALWRTGGDVERKFPEDYCDFEPMKGVWSAERTPNAVLSYECQTGVRFRIAVE